MINDAKIMQAECNETSFKLLRRNLSYAKISIFPELKVY